MAFFFSFFLQFRSTTYKRVHYMVLDPLEVVVAPAICPCIFGTIEYSISAGAAPFYLLPSNVFKSLAGAPPQKSHHYISVINALNAGFTPKAKLRIQKISSSSNSPKSSHRKGLLNHSISKSFITDFK